MPTLILLPRRQVRMLASVCIMTLCFVLTTALVVADTNWTNQFFIVTIVLPKQKKNLKLFSQSKNLVKKSSSFFWSLVDYIGGLLPCEKFLDTS